jgi:hypothetical protein
VIQWGLHPESQAVFDQTCRIYVGGKDVYRFIGRIVKHPRPTTSDLLQRHGSDRVRRVWFGNEGDDGLYRKLEGSE